MSLKLDNKTVKFFEKLGIEKIKVFFYGAGCSGTKLNIIKDFDLTDVLIEIENNYSFKVFVEKNDKEKFENCTITMIKVNLENDEHNKGDKYKFIYSSEEVIDRCSCGSSFSFEKKKPKLNLENLKNIKNNFKNEYN